MTSLVRIGPAQQRFMATLCLAAMAFGLQWARFDYVLIGSEAIHAALIVAVVLAWLVALVITIKTDWRWGLAAMLSAPFALVFFVWAGLIFYACAANGQCI